jgi:hypothetical protein
MVAGPGAAYICENCLQLCTEILHDPLPFSPKALELASRPPIVVAAQPALLPPQGEPQEPIHPRRTISLELEQRHQEMTLILNQLRYYQSHFELHYLWIRPPLLQGFSFVPRIIFILRDSLGHQWTGDRGSMLFARTDLDSGPHTAVYQGHARFRPLPPPEARTLTIQAADPLGIFEDPPCQPWHFDISLP